MTLKRWVIWLLVVAFLAGEVFLFLANREKDAALISLHDAQAQIVQLKTQLNEFKNSSAQSQNAAVSRLRADNLDLPRLRNQVTRLEMTNRQLFLQLSNTLLAARQQQDQLQQLQTENQPAATMQPTAEQSPPMSEVEQANACINNLRQIESAKLQWALENNKTDDAIPTAQDLLPYFQGGVFPTCPAGGIYTINSIAESPTCSVPGHVLPQE